MLGEYEGRRKHLTLVRTPHTKLDRRSSAVWEYCPLTQRQLEILQHASEGLTNQGIADELGISRGTVVKTIQVIRGKLGLAASPSGANAVVVLVAIAMREGWIQ